MKFIRFLVMAVLVFPSVSFGAADAGFQNAARLLSAARRGDTQTIQMLINSGTDINYVDSTGLSVVCTAVMNNDKRAIQFLQMYGADASGCDKQIKKYKQRSTVAAKGEEYDFFSGLSSTHIVVLSALGVAAVVGGVALLSDVFDSDKKNNNGSSSSGGSHGSGNNSGETGTSASAWLTVPYGPAYLTSTGTVDKTFDISDNLATWDSTSIYEKDFKYLQQGTSNNYIASGITPTLENYLLDMGGYYSFASGYMGQNIFRDSDNAYAPLKAGIVGAQGRPVRVALITGNGINPAGSADSGNGIPYAIGTALDAITPHVPKYLNNKETKVVDSATNVVSYYLSEIGNAGFDLSGSGSAFNPFASANDSALAKIVAGWEADGLRSYGDLYGFVPKGQLAIYRTGNGTVWENVSGASSSIGNFEDKDTSNGLSAGDEITIGSGESAVKYDIVNAVGSSVTDPTVTVNGTIYKLASASKMFLATCATGAPITCKNFAIYVGTDGYWYVNTDGGNDIDTVYNVSEGNIYVQKTAKTNSAYSNFTAMKNAVNTLYSVTDDPSDSISVDIIANTNVIPSSRNVDYVTVNNFNKAASANSYTDLQNYYRDQITSYYGVYGTEQQGGTANNLFVGYSLKSPMIIMPAGDYLYKSATSDDKYYDTLSATFENYAPMLYNGLKHNFMTIVGVLHTNGTSTATTIEGYGDGTTYGKYQLAGWSDSYNGTTPNGNRYRSRMCGIAGVGNPAGGIDPWCFAASGPTAEMATASAAGAVASVKAAFSYMANNQIFTLLALTADGPYLNADMSGEVFTDDTLVKYLKDRYEIPLDLVPLGVDSLSSSEYLDLFKTVYGYGMINLRRAIQPGFSIYRYDATTDRIISVNGTNNIFWGNSTSSSRASSVLSLSGRKAITTSFYDVLESFDGSISLPRVWTNTIAMGENDKRGLYMGDVLGDFNVDSTNKRSNQIGNLKVDMAMSQRAYNDNLNGLDNMRVAWTTDNFDIATEYQYHLTDGESRFDGRANGVLGLMSNTLSANTMYKNGRFGFGGRAFVGAITDENLLDKDPVVSSQFEPGRLGLANGGSFDTKYITDTFGLSVSLGVMRENNTVLGMLSDGVLAMNNADTQYIDTLATYKPFDNVKLSLRGTFATTRVDNQSEFIAELSDIKSNAFAFGIDIGGFSFTAAMPLAVVDGKMGYGYAEFEVVENNGKYEIAVNNPHMEYIDLSAQKRELRFSSSYKHALGEFTDAGIGLIYRINPNNIDVFGNESIFMFKLHHRLGI